MLPDAFAGPLQFVRSHLVCTIKGYVRLRGNSADSQRI